MPEPSESLTTWIKRRSRELGFFACGISRADFLEEEKERLEWWLKEGMQGDMHYMKRNLEKRLDPRLLLENARSVISFLYNYFPKETLPEQDNYFISKYAYGRDYHLVIREKLHLLIRELRAKASDISARAFTDSAPVLDRAWARKSGLGWIGKNTCLIHPKSGSFFFIAEIITDLELEPENKTINDLCGGCTRCIDQCPTGALTGPRVLDSRKCISYLTIEDRNALPGDLKEGFGKIIFGCDICQDVCPWNRFSIPHQESQFDPSPRLKSMTRKNWQQLREKDFDHLFNDSAVQRAGFSGLKRNIDFLKDE